MLSPKTYKATFYGEVKSGGSFKTDFTRSVAIPPLELSVSTSPSSVDVTKGDKRTVEVTVNTTKGYEPTVNLYATSPSKYLVFDFTQNDTKTIQNYQLRLPSYGIATIPLTISSPKAASTGPSTFFIFANSSFPPEQFIRPKAFQKPISSSLPAIESENIITQSTLLANIQDPKPIIDQIGESWSKIGGPISFISGLVTGHVGPWIFNNIREKFRNRKKRSHTS
jgi:hypothetical protein